MSEYPITWITDSLAVGHAPMSYAELDSIRARGVDAIVNLCAEFSDLHELERAAGFEVCYLPVWDEDIPAMEEMENALAWLDEAIYLGKKVLIHCRYGIGRTGTFVTSYMVRRGFGLKAAKKTLKRSRATPTSYGQRKLLKKIEKKAGVLTLRKPSMEIKGRMDLGPFLTDYEALIAGIDKGVGEPEKAATAQCGKGKHGCCFEAFDLQLVEAVYLHAEINRGFTSEQRESLIERAVSASKWEGRLCPLNDGTGCLAYEIRPVRCRIYRSAFLPEDENEIQAMLFELSRTLFLAFSGNFLPDTGFRFSVVDTVSGKFVQKYFHYISGDDGRGGR